MICILVSSASSFNPNDKVHRRTPSGGNQLDRPGAPPPHPPSVLVSSSASPVSSSKQRQSLPVSNSHHEDSLYPTIEEKLPVNDSSIESNQLTTPTNENVNVGKLISELNNRMAAAARINQNQTQTQSQSNNIRASIIRNSTTNTPGETTDF